MCPRKFTTQREVTEHPTAQVRVPPPSSSVAPKEHLIPDINSSPRGAARRFTPELADLVDSPLYEQIWSDERLSPRDRSIATLSALIALYRPDELRAHLRRGIDNGLTTDEISALITHIAFYAGFPAAISASVIAADTLL
ncbi:carboxymuconolactone decarboxylase family protein [Mycobacterium sp. Root135]|uniref:carboxymuconolactone decarboxylase family protein n=1 Tax=Mycobacterium sp. Root135 TaxID=1736457 RepID=UPI0009E8EE41|nr:carboxymuconolactone decarboxylase family protein [Mycobacterium sp. Root135]